MSSTAASPEAIYIRTTQRLSLNDEQSEHSMLALFPWHFDIEPDTGKKFVLKIDSATELHHRKLRYTAYRTLGDAIKRENARQEPGWTLTAKTSWAIPKETEPELLSKVFAAQSFTKGQQVRCWLVSRKTHEEEQSGVEITPEEIYLDQTHLESLFEKLYEETRGELINTENPSFILKLSKSDSKSDSDRGTNRSTVYRTGFTQLVNGYWSLGQQPSEDTWADAIELRFTLTLHADGDESIHRIKENVIASTEDHQGEEALD